MIGNRRRRLAILLGALVLALLLVPFRGEIRRMLAPIKNRLAGQPSVADRIDQYGEGARGRLMPHFEAAGIAYPPARVTFIGIKDQRILEVWASGAVAGSPRLIHRYPILASSGTAGPKLMEGDGQVPEGIYRIESLNPNSRYHLSLRLNYPNEFDLEHANAEGREFPGSDIMIHGNQVSIGCLAMGDVAAEELFVLAAEAGIENVRVILDTY